MEAKALSSLIKKIGTNAKTQREDIQTALIGCAYQAQLNRNVEPCIRLMDAIGNGVYRAGVSKWLSLNAPVHFKKDRPMLSDVRQKETESDMTIGEFMDTVKAAVVWHEMDKENNTAPNVWDSGMFAKKVDEYLLASIRKAAKEDASLSEALDRAHSLFRKELAKVMEVVEA